jgi:uncharacterized membrane protein YdjX (TVP38/TMEM64 family)
MIRVPGRLVAPALLVLVIAAAWVLGFGHVFSWSGLARERVALLAWVGAHRFSAPLLFVLVYTASVTLSLPQATLLTVTGGLLFGTALGGALAVVGATIGAVALFMIARSAVGDSMTRRGGAALTRLRQELARDGFSYLLAIRLLPVVPFWLVNLAAALCGIRLSHFVTATLIGVIPATFIFASVGAGLSDVAAAGHAPTAGILLSVSVLGPLAGLAALSLTPVIWRKWRNAHA